MITKTHSSQDQTFILKSDWLLDALYPTNKKPITYENLEIANIFNESPIVNFVLNFSTKGYAYVSESVYSVYGILPDALLKGGVSNGISLFSKTHREIFANQILPLMVEWWVKIAETGKDSLKTKITYNIEMLDKNGKIFPTMHILKPITKDENGLPILVVKYIVDVSKLMQNIHPDLKFEYLNDKEEYEIIESKTFYEHKEESLSNREYEIMDLVSKGYSSKEIADKLSLSIHTVNNHRKNIVAKYKVKSLHQISNPILQ